jgi:hypothetical protein
MPIHTAALPPVRPAQAWARVVGKSKKRLLV